MNDDKSHDKCRIKSSNNSLKCISFICITFFKRVYEASSSHSSTRCDPWHSICLSVPVRCGGCHGGFGSKALLVSRSSENFHVLRSRGNCGNINPHSWHAEVTWDVYNVPFSAGEVASDERRRPGRAWHSNATVRSQKEQGTWTPLKLLFLVTCLLTTPAT